MKRRIIENEVKKVENKIENQPLDVIQSDAPEGIKEEAYQVLDNDKRNDEANDEVIKNEINADTARAMDFMNPSDKTMIDGDIDEMSDIDEMAIKNDFGLNEDEPIDVIDEPEEPSIEETAVSEDEVDAADAANNPMDEVSKRVEDIVKKYNKDMPKYKAALAKMFTSQEAPTPEPSISQPSTNVSEIANQSAEDVPINANPSSTSRGLPNISVPSGSVSSASAASATSPDVANTSSSIKASGSNADVSTMNDNDGVVIGGKTVGKFLENLPKGVIDASGNEAGDIVSKPLDLPSGGGHTEAPVKDADGVVEAIAERMEAPVKLVFDGKEYTDLKEIKEIVDSL